MIGFVNSFAAHRATARVAGLATAALMAVSISGAALARDAEDAKQAEAVGPEAPLQMLVSLKEQKINVYRGTELIRTAPISSGSPGRSTPSGVFSILEKRRKHFSNLYNNAPMPFMQRLTWSGVAMHQGRLPGYPASHGCIRLPRDFAKDLFGITERGLHVVVTQEPAQPEPIRHAVLPQPLQAGTSVASLSSGTIAADPALRGTVAATDADSELALTPENPDFDKPLRMIITPRQEPNQMKTLQSLLNKMGYDAGPVDGVLGRKTRAAISLFQEGAELPVTGNVTTALVNRIYQDAGYEEGQNATLRIRRSFRDIYEAPVTLKDADKKIGTFVYTALGFEQGDAHVDWMAVPAEGEQFGTPTEILDRVVLSDKVRRDLSKMLTPGTSLIVTDRSFARNTGLGTDFVVVTR
ncbi:L,D-transpeptidase [uncultured Roseibium sp.]|uniref:L,D-transpeptidase n=1 Tax=uncultured Roseibium sp. TaxID=1936171 RepID=UPI0032170B8A